MNQIHILLVEDNEGDILLTMEALSEGKIANDISVVRDGKEAIDYLHKVGNYISAVSPDLILLDINLPKVNGKEVLKQIKTSPDLKHITVKMLTTSSSDKDILESYANYANCYITKPVDVNDFINEIAKLHEFWFSIVKLPVTN